MCAMDKKLLSTEIDFESSTQIAIYLRDVLKLPASVAKSISWQLYEQRSWKAENESHEDESTS